MIRYILFALIIAFIITLIVMKVIPWIRYKFKKYQQNIIDKEEKYQQLITPEKKKKSRKERKGRK